MRARFLADAPRLVPPLRAANPKLGGAGDVDDWEVSEQLDAALVDVVGELGLVLLPGDARASDALASDSAVRRGLHDFVCGPHAAAAARGWTPEGGGNAAWPGTPDRGLGDGVARACYGGLVVEGDAGQALMGAVPGASQLLAPPARSARPTRAVWAFFGSNDSEVALAGKPEHVDDLRPGFVTMHAQLCGEKVWRLRPHASAFAAGVEAMGLGLDGAVVGRADAFRAPRPTSDTSLAKAGAESEVSAVVPMVAAPGGRLEVRCRAGDRLIVDTGAWYHETSLPPRTSFSLSVARDFAFGTTAPLEHDSSQMLVSRQLCARCNTPTATPAGAPPGTCGCLCCETRRRERTEWESFRRSSVLAQRFLTQRHRGGVERALCCAGFGTVGHRPPRRRMQAICDG